MKANRREWMTGVAALAICAVPFKAFAVVAPKLPIRARPLPLTDVRLTPSDYATAVEVNVDYLLSLSPDRFLHNFRKYAGLEPKAPIYGGWESDTIAGHSLGHYMTALVLAWQQTGHAECRRRADYIVEELALCQAQRSDGYIGALGRKTKDGKIVDGEEVFQEVRKGVIRSGGFDLNGSWSPLYTVHKIFAGLLDIHGGWGNDRALKVLTAFAAYFENVFAALDDAQMEELLHCEYGGLNESYAELYARTGDMRWLKVAERIYDHRVLDPLEAQEDKLANFHANTQVPKLIGLGRIHELTGQDAPGRAARFFWERVTKHHSYVIGGNADREYFFAPDKIAEHITESTCEHCNTYNMLKLTRQLFSWQPDGALFDYYERAHLNHVMSAQNPATGGFTYMTPMMSGTARGYSQPGEEAFWCCVGSGMESHAKHGDSIYWEGDDTLFVNLYIPSRAQWKAKGVALTLATEYPFRSDIALTLDAVKHGRFALALRIPGWAGNRAAIRVNGAPVPSTPVNGYAVIERRWKQGDVVSIDMPLELRLENAQGSQDVVSVMHGPMVMAADLGPVEMEWEGVEPAMVGENPLKAFSAIVSDRPRFQTSGVMRPDDLMFVPFYSQYDRRNAVYFKRFTESGWKQEEAAFLAEQARQKDIAARSIDVMHLGEMQPERDHNLTSEISYPAAYRGRNGRDARSGGFFEFAMKVKPGPLVLQTSYWGSERSRVFDILVDGQKIATQRLNADRPGKFFDVDYPLPEALTRGKSSVQVRFEPHDRSSAGPVFGVRLFTAKANDSQ
ncbi:glycoside hydrolase family 127 protein [Novosphingobium beihaiensis]|uniref:Glycoside hydrolase family 127 protein n=1 Tax=Novosphingobium beihaiensis TaxID=2930389 RepID=A0ABT0BLS2_9SPHN|nr:glycoside hydrolase family 127 protein [Novosphingobium beihaiensis]MCJ2185776.1 glycoside hydrolase family 127 protein [Novosphingobium beihaiensis]